MNVTDLLGQLARTSPARPAIIDDAGRLSYLEFELLVARYAARLARAGVEPGQLIGLSLSTSRTSFAMMLAIARMGAVSVPMAPERPAETRHAECMQFGVHAILAEDRSAAIDGTRFIGFDAGWSAGDDFLHAGYARPGRWPWRLHISSGTTGRRLKGVLDSHQGVIYGAVVQGALGLSPAGQRFLVGLPLTVGSAIRPTLRSLLSGAAIIVPKARTPEDISRAIIEHQATDALLDQFTVQRLIARLPAGRGGLPSLARLVVGGFVVSPELLAQIADRIAPDVVTTYGATETGLVALAQRADLERMPGAAGRIAPGVALEIVDDADQPLPDGEVGIVRVRSAGCADRYVRDPELTAKIFRDGWVYPGDYGRYGEDGYLYLESRVDDVIKVGGNLIHLAHIDRLLASSPGVREAASFAFTEADAHTAIHAAVVPESEAPQAPDPAALIAQCREKLGPLSAPRSISFVSALARNDNGKVMRHELLRRWKAGELK